MNKLKTYHFISIYNLANLIEQYVDDEFDFWNFNEIIFIEGAAKFHKNTLLHLYIVVTLLNHYSRVFHKDDIYEEEIAGLCKLFDTYLPKVKKPKILNDIDDEDKGEWFDKNMNKFARLFDKMSEEVFYILFANRSVLLKFNQLVAKTILNWGDLPYDISSFPEHMVTKKGTLKRSEIPSWVKKAVFHRDKGRCVYCNTDLTNLINTFTSANFDHMVPLDSFGSNDPCNIQLTCESCNKRKSNKIGSTSNIYIPWW